MDNRGIVVAAALALAATAFAGPGAPQRRCRFNIKTIDSWIEMYVLDKNLPRTDLAKDPAWKERLRKDGYLQDFPRCFRASWHYGSEYYRGGARMMEKAFPEYYEVMIPLDAPPEYELRPGGELHCTAHGTMAENEKTEQALRPPVIDFLDRLPFIGASLLGLLACTFAGIHAVVNRKEKN